MHHHRNKGALWGQYTPSTPPKKITAASSGGYHPSIWSVGTKGKASCGALGGHFRWRRPWLWWLWCQLCIVLRLLKNAINTKISCLCLCKMLSFITMYCKTYCTLCNADCSIAVARVVAWPEPKPLLSNGTPTYWVYPESSCHRENNSHIVL